MVQYRPTNYNYVTMILRNYLFRLMTNMFTTFCNIYSFIFNSFFNRKRYRFVTITNITHVYF